MLTTKNTNNQAVWLLSQSPDFTLIVALLIDNGVSSWWKTPDAPAAADTQQLCNTQHTRGALWTLTRQMALVCVCVRVFSRGISHTAQPWNQKNLKIKKISWTCWKLNIKRKVFPQARLGQHRRALQLPAVHCACSRSTFFYIFTQHMIFAFQTSKQTHCM